MPLCQHIWKPVWLYHESQPAWTLMPAAQGLTPGLGTDTKQAIQSLWAVSLCYRTFLDHKGPVNDSHHQDEKFLVYLLKLDFWIIQIWNWIIDTFLKLPRRHSLSQMLAQFFILCAWAPPLTWPPNRAIRCPTTLVIFGMLPLVSLTVPAHIRSTCLPLNFYLHFVLISLWLPVKTPP